ncbi:Crp/Fnr family transcriptional regulator [Pseudomaricurvus alkylphenolicus]|uniref:Crp/Fnr family transcriptional regulator n=1 Tax=Pseudomaricurvus alkylphenolicus TaxID=1306991 RepID=UPI00142449A2|nr:Crp/Fnr family transcriptional regulator [Pseudomaricurvus alkylphenolicus]NIB38090.1 Crp/Fnr family transcriptional regulator [Pseudomaricurvus alkylphenolicus]
MSELFEILSHTLQAPVDGFDQFEAAARLIKVPAQQELIPAHQIPTHLYVVKTGLARAVFFTQAGKEYSKEFFWENDLIFAMRHLITGQPIPYKIVTVETCQLYQIPVAVYRKLVDSKPQWKDYHLKQLEIHLLAKEIKEELLLLNSNEQKVERAYQLFPDFVTRVPATLLASYLGLTPVSLSRIKKRLGL